MLPDSLKSIAVTRNAPSYESARHSLSWNKRLPDRFPELIVHARKVEDVQNAVRYAAAHGLQVGAVSGGHNYIASSIRDRIMVIDVSAMNSITINVEARNARAGAGVKSGELAIALADKGWAFPVGHCAGPALGGYLLGGGFGINYVNWGLSCFMINGFEMVDSRGEVRWVDQNNSPELLWFARGCGPAFPGVITSFDLALKSLPAVASSIYAFPIDDLGDVARWVDSLIVGLPKVELAVLLVGGQILGEVINAKLEASSYFVLWGGRVRGDSGKGRNRAPPPAARTARNISYIRGPRRRDSFRRPLQIVRTIPAGRIQGSRRHGVDRRASGNHTPSCEGSR